MAAGNLRGALDGEAGDEVERGGQKADVVERGAGFVHEGFSAMSRSGDPQQRRIRALSQGGVPSGGLPKLVRRRGDVEDVVGDLECEADGGAVGSQRFESLGRGPRRASPEGGGG